MGQGVTMISKTFRTTIVREGSICFIPLTFDPRAVFGNVRAPVRVTLNGYTYSPANSVAKNMAIPPLRSSRPRIALRLR
jgi:hypothetical protein